MKKRILKFVNSIEDLFQIQNYDKTITFKEQDTDRYAAEILFNEKYQTIEISIYPCFFNETLEAQRKILLHELIHTITLSSKKALTDLLEGKLVTEDRIDDINERETSQIENILDGLLQGKLKYAIDAYKKYTYEKPRRIHKRTNKTNKQRR